MKKLLSIVVVLLSVTLLLASCTGGGTPDGGTPSGGAPDGGAAQANGDEGASSGMVIGEWNLADFKSDKPESEWEIVSVTSNSGSMWIQRGDLGVDQFAADTGINAYAMGPPESDVAAELQIAESLVNQGVDALIMFMADPDAFESLMKTALDKGIVVISIEAPNMKNRLFDIEAFVDEEFGAALMDLLAEHMDGEGQWASMTGGLTRYTHMAWQQGALKHQLEAYPDMQLVSDEVPTITSGDTLDGAYERAKEVLTKYPDLKGFLASSAQEPIGIARALEEMGKQPGDVKVVGTAIPSAVGPHLDSGYVSSVFEWDPMWSNYAACELAAKILRGEELDFDKGVDLGSEGWVVKLNADPSLVGVVCGTAWIRYDADNWKDHPNYF